jgi:small subunit ribosomal protein S4e
MHMKRYSMPRFWPLSRKEKIFVVRPMPGPHPKDGCIPLQIIVRDMLRYAENSGEARSIIVQGNILVDKKERKDPKFPVGLMDIIEVPKANKHFMVNINEKGLFLQSISEKEASKKLCRIRGKTTLKGGVQQLNLHDGRNLLVSRDVYRVGDSILISLPDQKILNHHKLEKGSAAIVIAGRNAGERGKIKEIARKKNMLEKAMVTLETKKGNIQTLRDYIMVGEAE